ncbi:MAG: ribosomal-processing cysteine protease Prp [Clostridia bacterium]|nr:ribosomal-processing cysteine protease Prp [Clostridia bacterium]
MTEAIISRSGGRCVGFEITGHTEFAEYGSDIVCSAISAIAQTCVLGLSEHLNLDIACVIEEGYMYCMLDSAIADSDWSLAEILFETMLLGLKSIALSYANNLKIIEREV